MNDAQVWAALGLMGSTVLGVVGLIGTQMLRLTSRVDVLADRMAEQGAAIAENTVAIRALSEQTGLRLAQVDARFDQVDARLNQVDARFDQVDARFDQVDATLVRISTALLEHLNAPMRKAHP